MRNHVSVSQATVARGDDEDQLRSSTRALTKAIADYKQGAKSATRLAKPPKSTAAEAKAESGAWSSQHLEGVRFWSVRAVVAAV